MTQNHAPKVTFLNEIGGLAACSDRQGARFAGSPIFPSTFDITFDSTGRWFGEGRFIFARAGALILTNPRFDSVRRSQRAFSHSLGGRQATDQPTNQPINQGEQQHRSKGTRKLSKTMLRKSHV